jgi:ABC-type bacteriocin/lantibiotic exporter with double-glycine peptidase domain
MEIDSIIIYLLILISSFPVGYFLIRIKSLEIMKKTKTEKLIKSYLMSSITIIPSIVIEYFFKINFFLVFSITFIIIFLTMIIIRTISNQKNKNINEIQKNKKEIIINNTKDIQKNKKENINETQKTKKNVLNELRENLQKENKKQKEEKTQNKPKENKKNEDKPKEEKTQNKPKENKTKEIKNEKEFDDYEFDLEKMMEEEF